MGAALLPALIAPLLGAAVQSVFAPPAPKQTVIQPAPIQPSLSSAAASQIAANTTAAGQQFGSQMLNSILARAKAQGVGDKELSSVSDKFNTWFNQNSSNISQALALKAAHSQAQADYQNAIQNNNFNAQMQALQAAGGGGAGIGGALAKGLTGALTGGFGGGVGPGQMFSAPTVDTSSMISGPDTFDFSA